MTKLWRQNQISAYQETRDGFGGECEYREVAQENFSVVMEQFYILMVVVVANNVHGMKLHRRVHTHTDECTLKKKKMVKTE